MADNETTFKYRVDADQFQQEIDSLLAKIKKLEESMDRTTKKFGGSSPQATMVKNSLDKIMSDLDKRMSTLDKMNTKSNATGAGGGISSTERDLDKRYKTEHMRFMREELKNLSAARTTAGVGAGVFSGLINLSRGGGLSGFAAGLNSQIQQVARGGGFFGPLFNAIAANRANTNIAANVVTGGTGGAGGAGGGGAGGAGGIVAAFRAQPLPVKLVELGAKLLGAEVTEAERAATSKFVMGRRAAGYGASLGSLRAFDTASSAFVNPDSVMASMRDARYDITSPSYQAMRIAGINPSDFKGPTGQTDMARANLLDVQKRLRGFGAHNEQTMLTMAHAYGLQNRGVSDEDMLRLYNPEDKSAVADLLKRGKGQEEGLKVTQEEIDAGRKLVTDLGFAASQLDTFASRMQDRAIVNLDNFTKSIGDATDGLNKMITAEDSWITKIMKFLDYNLVDPKDDPSKGIWDWIKKQFSGGIIGSANAADLPATDASTVSFEDMADKLGSSGKNLPVEDTALLDWIKTASSTGGANFGGGGGSGGGGGGGGRAGGGGGGRGGGGDGGTPDTSGSGGSFMDAMANIESGNKNIPSTTDRDVTGPGTKSQGYWQINTPTWRDFAPKAGVDLKQYPNAMSAPRSVQEQVALTIPLRRFGPRTQRMIQAKFGRLNLNQPLGVIARTHGTHPIPAVKSKGGGLDGGGGGKGTDGSTLTSDFSGLNLKKGDTIAGGAAEEGLVALAKHEQTSEGDDFGVFSAINDMYHHRKNPDSAHTSGLAFDATLKAGDYGAGRKRMNDYLTNLGFKAGDYGRTKGDFWIEPGTDDHLHVQFNSKAAAERYYKLMNPGSRKSVGMPYEHEIMQSHRPSFPHTPTPQPKTQVSSLNNISHFQGTHKPYSIRIDNQAGANYVVQGGMLGNTPGGSGMA